MGMATRLTTNPHAEALESAREIAQKNPDAIRAAKRLMNALPVMPDAEGLLAESREQDALGGKPNQIEAVMSQMQRRAPNFT